jgi:hypothetical protein
MSAVTGETATVINIQVGAESFYFYTYNVSQSEFVDVGLIVLTGLKERQLLAYSSERLDDGKSYVIDYGTIIYLNQWGNSSSKTPIVKIEKIHQTNWFDEFISRNRHSILVLMTFSLVGISTLLCLPFIAYHVEYIEEKKRKKSSKNE